MVRSYITSGLIAISICLFIYIALLLSGTDIFAEQYSNPRFEVVERIVMYQDRYGDVPALILKDKETGVKYIYVLAYRSTSLTRLWDK